MGSHRTSHPSQEGQMGWSPSFTNHHGWLRGGAWSSPCLFLPGQCREPTTDTTSPCSSPVPLARTSPAYACQLDLSSTCKTTTTNMIYLRAVTGVVYRPNTHMRCPPIVDLPASNRTHKKNRTHIMARTPCFPMMPQGTLHIEWLHI